MFAKIAQIFKSRVSTARALPQTCVCCAARLYQQGESAFPAVSPLTQNNEF